MLSVWDAVGAGAGGVKLGKALEGGFGNPVQGVVGEESLMAGNEDIGEGEESGKDVVRKDIGGVVSKKEACFLLINVNGETPDLAAFETGNDGMSVKDGPAAGVDKNHASLHSSKSGGVDQVAGGGQERNMECENVRFAKNLLQGDIARQPVKGSRGGRVMGEDPAAKAVEVANDLLPNGTRADHPNGFLFQLKTFQPLELKVVFPNALAGAGNVAGKGKD